MSNKYQMPDDPRDFLKLLLEKAPKDLPSIKKIVGIGKVMYSAKDSMTAAVANTRPYTLIFGKEFMENNIRTDEDAVFILFHELTHLVLDHFALDVLELFAEKGIAGDNLKTIFAQQCTHIIVDAQVNATCKHTLKDRKYMEFPCDYYSYAKLLERWEETAEEFEKAGKEVPPKPEDAMPYCFLHPDGENECPEEFKPVHRKLYSEQGISNSELIDTLLPWFQENEGNMQQVIKQLMGNHKDLIKDPRTANPGDLSDKEKEILEGIMEAIDEENSKSKDRDYQQNKQGNKDDQELDKSLAQSRDIGDDLEDSQDKSESGLDYTLSSNPVKLHVRKIRERLRVNKAVTKILVKHFKPSPAGKLSRAIEGFFPKTPKRTVVPNFHNRRTSSLYSQGVLPVFHDNPIKGVKNTVACYIDVSGSQEHVVPKVLAAVLRYKKLMGNFVYCFSTKVEDVHVKDLNKHIFSYGGTDFNPIAQHMLDNKFKNVIVLTDGAAPLDKSYVEEIKRRKIKVVVGWTQKNIWKDPLADIASSQFWLFED